MKSVAATIAIFDKLKQSADYAPIYFLSGEEPYYIDKISDYIENNAIGEAERSFNQTILYGRDVSVDDILLDAKRFPMMAERQVVIVKEMQENAKLLNAESGEKLKAYIANPLTSTILVLCHKYKKLDGRSAAVKALKKTVFVNSVKVPSYELNAWITNFVQQSGYKIHFQTAEMIALHVGSDLQRVANELEKIFFELEKGSEVDGSAVEKYIGISRQFNVFELQSALLQNDRPKAMIITNYFAGNPKEFNLIAAIASLNGFFTKLLIGSRNMHLSDAELGAKMGIRNPYVVQKEYRPALKRFPIKRVVYCMRQMAKADLQSKGIVGNAMADKDILKEMVFSFLQT